MQIGIVIPPFPFQAVFRHGMSRRIRTLSRKCVWGDVRVRVDDIIIAIAFPPFRVENMAPPPISFELVRIFPHGSLLVGDARESSHEEGYQYTRHNATGARLLLRIIDGRRLQSSRVVWRDSKYGVNHDVIPLAVRVRMHEHALRGRRFFVLAFAEWAPCDRPALVQGACGKLTVFAFVSIRAAAAMMSDEHDEKRAVIQCECRRNVRSGMQMRATKNELSL